MLWSHFSRVKIFPFLDIPSAMIINNCFISVICNLWLLSPMQLDQKLNLIDSDLIFFFLWRKEVGE